MNNNSLTVWILGAVFSALTIVGGWAYNSIDARITANENRIDNIGHSLSDIRSDVSYIRGRLEPPLTQPRN